MATATLPEQFGRYRILKKLGQGGMGTVYLAHDTQLERRVALKVPQLDADDGPSVLQRFQREARAAATLDHPHLCQIYDVGTQDGVPYLTMAYVEGQTLAELLKGGIPPERDVVQIVRKVALALQEAHQHGVIHRDLKPANMMINRRGEPVVMDFGLAGLPGSGKTRLTRLGAVLGTPAYMAPEQVRGDPGAMGPPCDIYSLGVILYELLAGRVPFDGPAHAVLAQILTQPAERPSARRPEVNPRLEAVCMRAMSKDIAKRFASMGEMAEALNECLHPSTPPVAAAAPTQDARHAITRAAPVPAATDGRIQPAQAVAPHANYRHRPTDAGSSAARTRKPWGGKSLLGIAVAGLALAIVAVSAVCLLPVIWYWLGSWTAQPVQNPPIAVTNPNDNSDKGASPTETPADKLDIPGMPGGLLKDGSAIPGLPGAVPKDDKLDIPGPPGGDKSKDTSAIPGPGGTLKDKLEFPGPPGGDKSKDKSAIPGPPGGKLTDNLEFLRSTATDGKTVAAVQGNRVILTSAMTGKVLINIDHGAPVTALAFSPDGTRLATGGQDNAVALWNSSSGKQIWKLAVPSQSAAISISFSGDARVINIVDGENLYQFDAATGKETKQ